MRIALALACAAVALSGCLGIPKGSDCTVKMAGKSSFGSITPTGDVTWSAVCKHSDKAPAPADVPNPTVKSNG